MLQVMQWVLRSRIEMTGAGDAVPTGAGTMGTGFAMDGMVIEMTGAGDATPVTPTAGGPTGGGIMGTGFAMSAMAVGRFGGNCR
jgi:hypothetical protein